MSSTRATRSAKVKEENEIQTYINSFKEMEEQEDDPGTSDDKKAYEGEELDEYEEVLVSGEDQANDDDYKYVFIVQDEEELEIEEKAAEADGEIYEFDEMQEESLDDDDEKPKTVRIVSGGFKKPTGQNIPGNGHMCAFCNYTTPKRYLLARHMKCHSEDR